MYNAYLAQLDAEQVGRGEHRRLVGGFWDELGSLQLEFMIRTGLRPEMRLLDLGCGCLRGGVHFIRYLEPGNYFGLDLNASLVNAGFDVEVRRYGLSGRISRDRLLVTDDFDASRFGLQFDRVISVSLWTHLPLEEVSRSLRAVAAVLKPSGVLYATLYLAGDGSAASAPIEHPGGIVTNADRDPFHHRWSQVCEACAAAGLTAELIGDWGHPRGQQMARITRRDGGKA